MRHAKHRQRHNIRDPVSMLGSQVVFQDPGSRSAVGSIKQLRNYEKYLGIKSGSQYGSSQKIF
jgi:hypothetical protein